MSLKVQSGEYIGTTHLSCEATMLCLTLILSVGWNVNIPSDTAFETAVVVAKTVVHTCADGATNISNQYPQALVEVTGQGGYSSCTWSAEKYWWT